LQIVLPGGLVKEGTEVQIARVEIQYDE
jgi:hypothetical protein